MRLMTSQVCIFRARSILWAFVVPKLISLFTTSGRSAQPYSANIAVSAILGSGVLNCHLAKQQPWWGFKKFFTKWIKKRLHSAKRSTFAQFFSLFPWRKNFRLSSFTFFPPKVANSQRFLSGCYCHSWSTRSWHLPRSWPGAWRAAGRQE